MQKEIQPKYEKINVACTCGNKFTTNSTLCKDLHVDICSECHPFYTGTQKVVDAGGQIDKFRKKYAKSKKAEA